MIPVHFDVTIPLATPLHVGGEPGEDTNISYILRDGQGRAYYPGTAFKGKLRHYALQLQSEVCEFPKKCCCPACSLFGREGNAPGSLFFSNFRAMEQDITLRAGNAIDRYRRVADDQKLFTTEAAEIETLVGYITGSASDEGIKLLKKSVKLIQYIGGNTSRGFGWVNGEIKLEDQSVEKPKEDTLGEMPDAVRGFRIRLTPKSPLLIGTHTTQSNFRETQYVIPGGVLRAAIARAICEQDGTKDASKEVIEKPTEDSKFRYLREKLSALRLSTLYPCAQPEPLPITTRKCKFHEDHNKVDILAAMLNGTEQYCTECKNKGEEGRLEKADRFKMPVVTSTHSEIDKFRGTTQDGRLFTLQAIAPGTPKEEVFFDGTMRGEGIDWKALWGELQTLTKKPLRLGGKITSGFGECEAHIEALEESIGDEAEELKERIEEFNKHIGRDKIWIPITLMSDAIVDLKEPDGYEGYENAYRCLLPLPFDFGMERVITKPRIWRGFDTSKRGAKGCEKTPLYLLQAGSVFVISVNDMDATLDALLKLENEGIGEKTEDGYGAVRVAHARHVQYAITDKDKGGSIDA